jgi:hypothetical protein
LFILSILILNNVHFNLERLNMQMVLVENLALTFVGDARALVTGFGNILVKFAASVVDRATAPIDRIARACDVAGVLPGRRTESNLVQFRARRQPPAESQQAPSPRWLFPFRSLNHLT